MGKNKKIRYYLFEIEITNKEGIRTTLKFGSRATDKYKARKNIFKEYREKFWDMKVLILLDIKEDD